MSSLYIRDSSYIPYFKRETVRSGTTQIESGPETVNGPRVLEVYNRRDKGVMKKGESWLGKFNKKGCTILPQRSVGMKLYGILGKKGKF